MRTFRQISCLRVMLLFVILSLTWGCGSGGSRSDSGVALTTKIAFSNGASVSILPAGNGVYVVQGDQLAGVAGMEIIIGYDSSTLLSPTVTQSDLMSGALFVANTATSGTIKIAIISSTAKSGSGPIATISFAAQNGTGGILLSSVQMIDLNSKPFQ
jgi:hypothetical protein